MPKNGLCLTCRQDFQIIHLTLYTLTCSIADPGCLSRIRLFSIPDPGSELSPYRIPDPHQRIKYFNPKSTEKWFLSSRKYYPGCSSRIPDPGVKKAPDPGSGSATLLTRARKFCSSSMRLGWVQGCLGVREFDSLGPHFFSRVALQEDGENFAQDFS